VDKKTILLANTFLKQVQEEVQNHSKLVWLLWYGAMKPLCSYFDDLRISIVEYADDDYFITKNNNVGSLDSDH
jgi:hypothetical protein